MNEIDSWKESPPGYQQAPLENSEKQKIMVAVLPGDTAGLASTGSTGDYLPVVMHSIEQCPKPEAGRNDKKEGPCNR